LGQKTNPIGLRVGKIRGWESNWFESKSYATKLKEDKELEGTSDKDLIKLVFLEL
jgi:small subunit ribosomal protein S3